MEARSRPSFARKPLKRRRSRHRHFAHSHPIPIRLAVLAVQGRGRLQSENFEVQWAGTALTANVLASLNCLKRALATP